MGHEGTVEELSLVLPLTLNMAFGNCSPVLSSSVRNKGLGDDKYRLQAHRQALSLSLPHILPKPLCMSVDTD